MDDLPSDRAVGDRSNDSGRAIEDVVDELYGVMREDIPFAEKARQALEIGRLYLNADNGHLTRIDQETGHWEALVSTDPPDGQISPGLELDLVTTYCRYVMDSSSQLALDNAPKQGLAEDPAYDIHGFHCYVGTPLRVNEEQYGTVCFVANDPREYPYSNDEKMLAELITHILERELEREQHDAELTRQTNLSLVLNRVLRHNLRNEMAIIRGYTQMMTDAQADSTFGQTALQSIDRLIALSETARKLDEIVASDEARDRTNIRAILQEVVAGIRRQYPTASISIDCDKDITGELLPSFKRAMWELIENAVKHSGTQPTVHVAVASIPNAIEISIVDDGPGLDGQEIDVLRSGAETPLMHGSGLGLWLTHWIISRHDGSIEASVSEAGTTLNVTVPRTQLSEGTPRVSELVRASDRYKSAFDKAGDGMTITDDRGRILDVNDVAARLYGMDSQALLGRSIQEFLPEDFDFEAEWEEIQAAASKRGEVKILGADGDLNTVEYTAKINVVPGQHLLVSRDVTERREQERVLERTQDFFEAAQRLGNLGAWEVDGDETVRWTAGTRRIHEVEQGFEPTLRTALEFYHSADRPRIERALNEAQTAGKSFDIEARIITATGDLRWVRACGGPTDSGETVRGYTQDITDRKERESDLVQYEAAFTKAGDGMIITNGEAQILDVNAEATRLYGVGREELIGRSMQEFLPEDFDFEAEWGKIQAARMKRDEMNIVSADGGINPIEYTAKTNIVPGEHLFVIRDTTERTAYEQELEEQRNKFEVLNQVLRHDIRNDLQLVTAFADMIEDDRDQNQEYIETIQKNARHAIGLTSTSGDLLEVWLSESDEQSQLSLPTTLENVVEEVRSVHTNTDITLDGPLPDIDVVADDMLQSVFRNVIDNAIHHNDKDVPKVNISVDEKADLVQVRIADNGPGVLDSRKDAIFGKSEKGLDSSGTGLGLYLVKTLVERYGGTVRIEDADPEGAIFILELQKAPSEGVK